MVDYDYQALANAALQARERAYAPYSGFRVGAALLVDDGRVFLGCNVENAAYPACCCAERVAVYKAVSEGVRSFVAIAVASDSPAYTWPCGECRQVLHEFAPGMAVLGVNRQGGYEAVKLDELLPKAFG